MPPLREQDPGRIAASTSKIPPKKYRRTVEKPSNAVPGVQRIKASLRQTRRLLAKDDLAADLRVETERRLKALETDLHAAEVAKKERTLATRYHKVKFFERQKVIRKIKQVQNRSTMAQKKSEKKKLTLELHELRVDLNYILHYPKLKKYISLFPPEVRKGDAVSAISHSEAQETNEEREEIRIWIRDRMERGELPSEPELTLGSHQENERTTSLSRSRDEVVLETKTFKRKEQVDKFEEDEFFIENDAEDNHDQFPG